jgi:hypothetical protein
MATRKVDITYENRSHWDAIIGPVVNEVLGVEFDFENCQFPRVDGIEFWVRGKFDRDRAWDKDRGWQGVIIAFSFVDVDGQLVKRSLLVKADGAISEKKLQIKWAEMLTLKRADDARRVEREHRQKTSAQKIAGYETELVGLGVDIGYHPGYSMQVKTSGVDLALKGLTPQQVHDVLKLVELL